MLEAGTGGLKLVDTAAEDADTDGREAVLTGAGTGGLKLLDAEEDAETDGRTLLDVDTAAEAETTGRLLNAAPPAA